MADIGALASAASSIAQLSNLIIVSPQATLGYQPLNPRNPIGTQSQLAQAKAFVFQYEGEQSITLESDITDHYVEQNFAVADQIALKPALYDTYAYIGELNDVIPDFLQPLKQVADKLTTVVAYTPRLTATALINYNRALFLYQNGTKLLNNLADAPANLANAISGGGQAVVGENGQLTTGTAQNKQQSAFQTWYSYWQNRVLFNVQTPWAVFQNCAIRRLRAVQGAENPVVTDFEVSFKVIRTAQSLQRGTGNGDASLQGRLNQMGSLAKNNGTSAGTPGPGLGSSISTQTQVG